MSYVTQAFPCFWNVCCSGLPLESSPQKHKYQSATSTVHRGSTAASSVTEDAVVDVDCKTSFAELAASVQPTAAVDVVASMHSYAMPRYIGRPTKIAPRNTVVGTTSSKGGRKRHKASNNESEPAGILEHLVSHRLFEYISSCIGKVLSYFLFDWLIFSLICFRYDNIV